MPSLLIGYNFLSNLITRPLFPLLENAKWSINERFDVEFLSLLVWEEDLLFDYSPWVYWSVVLFS